jgi:phage FluMu protein Com
MLMYNSKMEFVSRQLAQSYHRDDLEEIYENGYVCSDSEFCPNDFCNGKLVEIDGELGKKCVKCESVFEIDRSLSEKMSDIYLEMAKMEIRKFYRIYDLFKVCGVFENM